MTNNDKSTYSNTENFVPVFAIQDNEIQGDHELELDTDALCFFDIKELYDQAYEALNAGRTDYKAKEMMAQAIKMDMAYRCKLARQSKYQKQSKQNEFSIVSSSL